MELTPELLQQFEQEEKEKEEEGKRSKSQLSHVSDTPSHCGSIISCSSNSSSNTSIYDSESLSILLEVPQTPPSLLISTIYAVPPNLFAYKSVAAAAAAAVEVEETEGE
jgi:hypothetical protein